MFNINGKEVSVEQLMQTKKGRDLYLSGTLTHITVVRVCEECKKEYRTSHNTQKVCSPACRETKRHRRKKERNEMRMATGLELDMDKSYISVKGVA